MYFFRQHGKIFPYGNGAFGSDIQGYSGDEAPKPKPKGKKKKFAWKITGISECSKSCGGGKYLLVKEKLLTTAFKN